jgi:hypothetical protein
LKTSGYIALAVVPRKHPAKLVRAVRRILEHRQHRVSLRAFEANRVQLPIKAFLDFLGRGEGVRGAAVSDQGGYEVACVLRGTGTP